jgi:S1-C subfamily serine protease
MPVQMPTSPPYAPLAEPPWADQWPPLPPPPAPPFQEAAPGPGRRPRRTLATALVVVVSMLCAAVGFEVGGALFGSPAITTPQVTRTAPLPTPRGATPSPGTSTESIADRITPAIVDINTTLENGTAAGTGMVLTSDGLVLTNNHVIAESTDIKVQIAGTGPSYSAKVLGYDITDDVALIKLDGASNLTTIDVGDSSQVRVGDHVVALGNALGRGGAPAVVQGEVTALDQTIRAGDASGGTPSQTLSDLIEVTAPLLPGDSGGPLVNTSAQVIGMNAAASSGNRGQTSGDGFAIPINKALDIAHQIQAGQSSDRIHIGDRALLGVRVQDAGVGATVAGVEPDSPADQAGIVAGDVITSVGSDTITAYADLPAALNSYHPGDRVEIGWTDATGQPHTSTVTLIAGPPA